MSEILLVIVIIILIEMRENIKIIVRNQFKISKAIDALGKGEKP